MYMVATNSLGLDYTVNGETFPRADQADLNEMYRAASQLPAFTRLFVYYAPYSADPVLMEILPQGVVTVETYSSEVSSVSSERMSAVLKDFESYAPLATRGLVLWSHANGWLEDGIEDDGPSESGIATMSFGSDRSKHMNVTTLARTLAGHHLDYIYFDCCLMGSAEVMYELRDCAKYIVASPSELPRDGMNYEENIPILLRGGEDNYISAANTTYNDYASKPNPYDQTATMVVVKTAALPALAEATAAIYDLTPMQHPLSRTTNYYGSQYATQGHYLDFAEYVRALAQQNEVPDALINAFESALSEAVIYSVATPKLWDMWPMYSSCGLSTRVFNSPAAIGEKGYDRLQWTADVVSHHINSNQ